MTSKKRLIFSYGILALLLAVLFAANLFWGSVSLTPGAVLAALTGRGRDALSVGIITQLRLLSWAFPAGPSWPWHWSWWLF